MREIICDLFAGGGGASMGIKMATDIEPHVAINHDRVALAMHMANHPTTWHLRKDIWEVPPRWATQDMPVGLLWASPDCKHFSRAKGSAPKRDREIRCLAWVVEKWAREVQPRIIILENVEEFKDWGPLDSEGKVIKSQKGTTFRAFVRRLKRHGYVVDWRLLRACDYGAPTIRKRLFLIARRDGEPIVWPEPTHGPGRRPYRIAAEIIDWSIPCPSIFDRKKPLAENTLIRIAKGIQRYVVETKEPFIVNLTHGGRIEPISEPVRTVTAAHRGEKSLVVPYLARIGQTGGNGKYCNSLSEPLTTITSKAEHLLCVPHLQRQFGHSVGHPADVPLGTVTAGGGGKTALVAAFLLKHYGGVVGSPIKDPIGTITSVDHHALTTSHLVKLRGTCRDGQPVTEPVSTVTAGGLHIGEVRAFLVKYFGASVAQPLAEPSHTLTSKDRLGLVTVNIQGEPYVIADIGMRMLSPRELFRAQGFPDSYQIDLEISGRRISKSDQVRCCGNSVCPPIAQALVTANFQDALAGTTVAAVFGR